MILFSSARILIRYKQNMIFVGIVDSSGIRFHVSSKLRKYDAGILELGLEYTDKMAIPPGQEDFPLSGYCVSECTAVVSNYCLAVCTTYSIMHSGRVINSVWTKESIRRVR